MPTVSATTKMFVALMRHDDDARSLVIDIVPEAFPWVRFLPTEDVRAFVFELVDTLRAADALENAAPVVQLITEWRHTAEVHADPELAARVRQGDRPGENAPRTTTVARSLPQRALRAGRATRRRAHDDCCRARRQRRVRSVGCPRAWPICWCCGPRE